jgi:hypothetical protein
MTTIERYQRRQLRRAKQCGNSELRQRERIERRRADAAARAVRRESTAAINRLLFTAIGVLPKPAARTTPTGAVTF